MTTGERKENYDDETDDETIGNIKKFIRRDCGGKKLVEHAHAFAEKANCLFSQLYRQYEASELTAEEADLKIAQMASNYADKHVTGCRDRTELRLDDVKNRMAAYRATIKACSARDHKKTRQIMKITKVANDAIAVIDKLSHTTVLPPDAAESWTAKLEKTSNDLA